MNFIDAIHTEEKIANGDESMTGEFVDPNVRVSKRAKHGDE
jgi:hypothetical protein